jgi:phosphohistidine phosphatase
MKTIYLLRHAKSAWSDADADDFDRPLNEQGQLNAVQIGHHLSDQKIQPDIILCSAAARTQETFSYIQSFLPAAQAIEIKSCNDSRVGP